MLKNVASAEIKELCSNCSKAGIKGLFFGDRHPYVPYKNLRAFVGNFREILMNSNCPLCRLISFAVSTRNLNALLEELQLESRNIDCFLDPWRADAAENTPFLLTKTQDLTATSLGVHLQVPRGDNQKDLE